MPKRTDIKKILIIGAGPIVIGQACEFDYSGAQACKALREEGFRVILVNSNPATIMTDPGVADAIYLETLTVASVCAIWRDRRAEDIAISRRSSAHPLFFLFQESQQFSENRRNRLPAVWVLKQSG